MISLTTPVAVPNITRIQVVAFQADEEANEGVVTVELRSPAGSNRVYRRMKLAVRNGKSEGLALNASPTGYQDLVSDIVVDTPTGFDTVLAAYVGAANKAARLRAVETALISLGVLGSGLGGTVS